jgi:hypothetical protein
MFHTIDTRRYRSISLLGLLFILLVILASVAANQAGLHQTHAASACQGPPAGFDATAPKVTNAQLEQYGLPTRPSARKQPREYARWLNLVQHDKHRICATGTRKMAFSGTPAVAPLSMSGKPMSSPTSSGYMAGVLHVGYVTGTWEVPCTQNDRVTASVQDQVQVGFPTALLSIGTLVTHTKSPGSGYGTDQDQYFVSFQGQGGLLADPTAYPINCGDAVIVQIMYNNAGPTPQWDAYIGDTSTNSSFAMTYTAGAAGGLPAGAFWGEVNPTSGVFQTPLYKFGTVTWAGSELADVSYQADANPISSQISYAAVQMSGPASSLLASPSALDSTGAGFTDTWQNPI